jgi:hypothetical protein
VTIGREGGRGPELAGVVLECVRGDDRDLHRMAATGGQNSVMELPGNWPTDVRVAA